MSRCARAWWSWRGRSRALATGVCACCLRGTGERVNHKRVYRVYREAGLLVRRKARKRLQREGCTKPVLTAANQEWALDFAHDGMASGRTLRVLSVVDAYTRECLALEVERPHSSLGYRTPAEFAQLASLGSAPGAPPSEAPSSNSEGLI